LYLQIKANPKPKIIRAQRRQDAKEALKENQRSKGKRQKERLAHFSAALGRAINP